MSKKSETSQYATKQVLVTYHNHVAGSEIFVDFNFSEICREDLVYTGLSPKEKGDKNEDYVVKLLNFIPSVKKYPTNTPCKDIVCVHSKNKYDTIQAKFATMFDDGPPGSSTGSTKFHGINEAHSRHVDFYVFSGAERGADSLILTKMWLVGKKDLFNAGTLEKSTVGPDYEISLANVKRIALKEYSVRDYRPDLFGVSKKVEF